MKVLYYLKPYLLKYKYSLILIFVLNLLVWGINILMTACTGKYVDYLISFKEASTIYKFTFILAVLGISSILVSYGLNYIFLKAGANLVFDINFDILKHVKKLPLKYFSNMDSTYLNQRINSDSNELVNISLSILIQSTIQVITFISIIIILLFQNKTLGFIVIGSIPIYSLIFIIFKKPLYKTSLEYKEKQNRFFSIMNKQLLSINQVKINSLFDKLDTELKIEYPNFLKSFLKFNECGYIFSGIGSLIENIFNIFLFLYGGFEILKNNMTVGDFIMIKSYYTVLISALSSFVSIIKRYPQALVANNRIEEILDVHVEKNGSRSLEKINNIKINNLSFKYDKSNILNKLNFQFDAGNIYLIKGINGSGKSSLIKNILGLYIDDFKGDILYNDVSIRTLDLYSIRKKKIGVVEQEPSFISKTVLDELTLNVDKVNNENLNKLIIDFGLLNIDKKINDSSTEMKVSGGEKQKISIIRNLLKDPDVLVLDEPSSALDSNSIDILKDYLTKIQKEKIIIMISHDKCMEEISNCVIQM
ncbi:MAG: ABC transporter transmembrane domain-containing protein [Clostridium sp.]|uniref:ABC transporter transmembrane domain-containing protein n=1 Tax=Clostridium chrysemydis TaxID=2665504 RepID=UPI003EE697FE